MAPDSTIMEQQMQKPCDLFQIEGHKALSQDLQDQGAEWR